jgi:hypothetical protein
MTYSLQVIGEPSQKLMTEMSQTEKDRVKQQQERLGPNGLKERGERLKKANEENGVRNLETTDIKLSMHYLKHE